MESRWFNIVVVLVWLSTTTWLVVAKIVPPLKRGEPPNYHSMYASNAANPPDPVGWELSLNGKSLGWAVSRLQKVVPDMTEVRSRIHFDRIPLDELLPDWLKQLVRTAVLPVDKLQMDAFSKLAIDQLGHLSSFESKLRVNGLSDSVINIRGKVHGSLLKIEVQNKEFPPTYLPPDALVADELSPQARLVDLRLNQEWTVPVFSPLRLPDNPVDILQARVESRDVLMWEGQAVPVFLVVYRSDSGSAGSSTRPPRAKLWVDDDGNVLKQEVAVLSSRLLFTRMSPEQSAEKAEQSRLEEEAAMRIRGRRGGNRPPPPATPEANFGNQNPAENLQQPQPVVSPSDKP